VISMRRSPAPKRAKESEGELPKVLKQGPLSRKETAFRTWKKRWFVLDNESLSYYRSEKAYQANDAALGCFSIQGCTAQLEHKASSKADPSLFQIRSSSSALTLKAPSPEIARDWVSLIASLKAAQESKSSTYMTLLKSLADDTEVKEHSMSSLWEDSLVTGGPTAVGMETRRTMTYTSGGLPLGFDSVFDVTASVVDYDEIKGTKVAVPLDELILELVGLEPNALVGVEASKRTEEFQECFLLYHRCFMDSSDDLFERLLEMFTMPASLAIPPQLQVTVRLNVINILQLWISKYFIDFSKSMKVALGDFVQKSLATIDGLGALISKLEEEFVKAEKAHIVLKKAVGLKAIGAAAAEAAVLGGVPTGPTTSVFLNKFVDSVDLLHIDPEAIAEQLTLYEFELFAQLTPREFVNREWTRETTSTIKAPNIIAMTSWWNRLTFWVASEILTRKNDADRRNMMQTFIKVGYHCITLRNFWGAVEIASALWMAPVYRLKKDWSSMPSKIKSMYRHLVEWTGVDGDYVMYRKAIKEGAGKAQIPHLVLHFRDLFGLDTLEIFDSSGNVFFSKYKKQWREVSQILQSQHDKYHIQENTPIRLALLKAANATPMTKDELFAASFAIAPKSKKTVTEKESSLSK